ncbi:tail completion protein gp17 [Microbulbifer sp. PSTR4-B]|uniref:tail completion protein gp17 n=1 Tax=Microbulbifer sp. PSTR4-B TaxID=3243396 RepID=UPI0040395890
MRPLLLPQDSSLPSLVYTTVADRSDLGIDGTIESDYFQVQIDIWAETYKQAKTLEQEARALHGFAGDLFGLQVGLAEISKNLEEYDNDTKRYRVSLDLNLYF